MSKIEPEIVKKLVKRGLKYLSYRSRSRAELIEHLTKQANKLKLTDPQSNIEAAIERIDEYGFINDLNFAHEWCLNRLRAGKGQRVVNIELKKKGVSESLITTAIENIDKQDWQKAALHILNKKSYKFKDHKDFKTRQKMKRYLYQRGFLSGTINAAIDDFGGKGVK